MWLILVTELVANYPPCREAVQFPKSSCACLDNPMNLYLSKILNICFVYFLKYSSRVGLLLTTLKWSIELSLADGLILSLNFYSATACNATHSIARPLCLSLRLFVSQKCELWQNERNLCPHFYTAWKIIHPSFLTKRMVGGGDPTSWNFAPNWPRWSENADFQSIFARIASAVTPSKKVQLTRIGSPLCAF